MEGELLKNIKARFDAEGIEIPFPQRKVWLEGRKMEDTPESFRKE
jgi:small-conductance mechanosensitive channel